MPKQNHRTKKTTRLPRRGLYNSLEPIRQTEFPHCRRAIGLWVDDQFHHKALEESVVEINVETCKYLDSISTMATVPTKHWRTKAVALTKTLIADFDRVMRELTEHRERLTRELANLESTATEVAPAVDLKIWRVHQVHEVEFYIQAESAQAAQANAHASIGAVTDEGADVFCGNPIAPGATLVDFDAAEIVRDTTVEEA